MENLPNETLDSAFISQKQNTRRRALLTWWIKAFIWIFMVFGVVAPLGFISGILGFGFNLSLYGLSTNEPLSLLGFTIVALFFFKGVTSFALWTEKDWAINASQIDAIIGIVICVLVMIFLPSASRTNMGGVRTFNIGVNFRLEVLFLIPYLVRVVRIKSRWNELADSHRS